MTTLTSLQASTVGPLHSYGFFGMRRPNYAIVPEQPCCFNLQVRAARSSAGDADQLCFAVGMH